MITNTGSERSTLALPPGQAYWNDLPTETVFHAAETDATRSGEPVERAAAEATTAEGAAIAVVDGETGDAAAPTQAVRLNERPSSSASMSERLPASNGEVTSIAGWSYPSRSIERQWTIDVQPLLDWTQEPSSRGYQEWLSLYREDDGADPLQHPDVVLSELRGVPPERLPAVQVRLLDHGVAHSVATLVPKILDTHRFGSVLYRRRLVGLRLAGNRFLARQTDVEAQAQLLKAVLEHTVGAAADFVLIEDLDDAAPLHAAMREVVPYAWLRYRYARVQPRRRIRVPENPQTYWEQFSKKTQQGWRRKLKKFGEVTLERITEPEQVDAFLHQAHEISLQTWQTRQFGLRVKNDDRERQMYTNMARHGLLRCYLWKSNGQPVAFTIGTQDKGCFHYEEVGYATPFAKYSPGLLMLWQMTNDILTHNTPQWFDFGGGDADYKQLFANHESASGTVWLLPPTIANRLTIAWLRACRRARRCVRQGVVLFGLASKARQWVRYGGASSRAKSTPTSESTDDRANEE
jgi:CelD/BcsL family acetyltransferase involved in cellulose biosynthesis